jgi:ABC-2 type transport system permease protein
VNRIRAVAWKEFLHVLRDRRTLLLVICMPIFQLVIYGYGIDNDVKHMATVVYDEDRSSLSRKLTESLVQSQYFDIVGYVDSPEQLRKSLDRGSARAGLHFPPNFRKDVLAGRSGDLQLLIDGTDSNPANTALNTSRAVIEAFMQREGLIEVRVMPIDFKPRLWYNPDLKTSFFMVPGVVGLLLQVLVPMITATAIVREKEQGNFEQLLATPIKPYEIMLGKLVPYLLIGIVIAASIIAGARLLFDLPIGFGLLASTIANNQNQAAQIVMFVVPPSILLSGFIFPRETMPLPIYAVSFLVPLTYFVQIIRGITLKGLGFVDLWPQIVPLAAMAVVVVSVSIAKFRKRLA